PSRSPHTAQEFRRKLTPTLAAGTPAATMQKARVALAISALFATFAPLSRPPWAHSSVGQSGRLLTGGSLVPVQVSPQKPSIQPATASTGGTSLAGPIEAAGGAAALRRATAGT